LKQSFAACGKLPAMSARLQRKECYTMTLDEFVAHIRRSRRLING
jgi:hypothetical protein